LRIVGTPPGGLDERDEPCAPHRAGGWIQIEWGSGNGQGNTAMLLTRYK